ncbi:WD40 repeat domain-containing protein [Chelatococcus sp. SYSU_G07232]|uniref:WD40 repeat domain-containing protein n=1 Tax=Chelatococcus albus TaxID=3047466 RepID=A0ABT7AG67_9HYPH|nr:WD40 repeat domain-containing protein [Chelatococcus sp. SYSU_G07232]MDJ1158353.1 WD40 repeat domain-containing protein [Chelatococcus sp. SYSU_G07232]
MAAPTLTSLTDHVAPLAAGAHVTAAAWLGDTAAFALGDGAVLLVNGGGESRVAAHPDGAVLVAASGGERLLTGGDDGRVVATRADGTIQTLADEKGRWIDALTTTKTGAVAWSTGKRVTARDEKGRTRGYEAPSTAQGLAFAPKGYRLAVAHYNGVSLWFPNTDARPEDLAWKGSHLDVTWSPDGSFVVTSMQENALHGWRLADKKDMRMSGYPAKTRSFAWSADGVWLATSGADAVIVWPFDKEGPMGRAPRECGVRHAKVSRVAFHPNALVLAAGYEDGCILLIRLTDASELLVRRAIEGGEKGRPITALAWDKPGRRLAFGSEGGAAGILTLP